jgi:DNA-binding transcriptional LysR family regulator
MLDWDDIRYFLAVAREGSVRAAAQQLKVNHSTVLRRIALLEQKLGAQLVEKLPSGYRLTGAGEEVLEFAQEMQVSSNRLEARVFGRDQSVRGALRVTLPPVVASHLLMTDFIDFAQLHPEVEIEVLSLDDPVNLTNREADVAIRNVYDRDGLPQNLHGLKGPEVCWSIYIARALHRAWAGGEVMSTRWIIKDRYGHPDWCQLSGIPIDGAPFKTTDAASQIRAVQGGLGMTLLPCFVGDPDPLLMRVPGCAVRMHGTLWLLTQGETRKTKRVRLFTEFIGKRLADRAALIEGRSTQS